MSLVYFILSLNGDKTAVKIGTTNGNPMKRLKSLQTGSAAELLLVAAVEGDADLEGALHATFAKVHERGEWFHLSGRLFSLIVGLHGWTEPGAKPLDARTFFRVCSEYIFDVVPTLIGEGEDDETWHLTADLEPLLAWFARCPE